METLFSQIKRLTTDYMRDNKININNLRVAVKAAKAAGDTIPTPLGVSINTVNGMLKYNRIPSNESLKKLLKAIECKYDTDSLGNITKLTSNDNGNKN